MNDINPFNNTGINPYNNSGLPAPSRSTSRSLGKALARYENNAYLAIQRERIDQIAFLDGATHSLILEFALTDQIRALANGDPVKLQLGAQKLAVFADCTNARLARRYGGVQP